MSSLTICTIDDSGSHRVSFSEPLPVVIRRAAAPQRSKCVLDRESADRTPEPVTCLNRGPEVEACVHPRVAVLFLRLGETLIATGSIQTAPP